MNIRRTKYYFYTQGYDQYGRPIVQQSDISADIIGKITPHILGGGNIDGGRGGGRRQLRLHHHEQPAGRDHATGQHQRAGAGRADHHAGGLVLKQETRSQNNTPLLGDLPLLGQLFRASHMGTEENVLTILITPHLGAEQRPAP